MLNTEIKLNLDEAYAATLKAVAQAQAGDEEAKWQLQKLAELHKQRMTEEQSEREMLSQAKELALKKEQLKEGKFDSIMKLVLDGVAIVIPCAISSYWMAKGLKFEETGSFTSKVGNWVSGHFRIFKK